MPLNIIHINTSAEFYIAVKFTVASGNYLGMLPHGNLLRPRPLYLSPDFMIFFTLR